MGNSLAFITIGVSVGLLLAEIRMYDFSPGEGSRFSLEVYKTGLMSGKKHIFVFERFSGEATLDPPKVRFTADAGSVVCTDTWINDGSRKKVLAAARDLMQADKYPQLTFTSSKPLPKGETQYDVEGMLTIRDKTRPVLVHVSVQDAVFEGNAVVKLSDFGLKPPKGATLGLIGTKDEMKVVFRLVGTR